MFFVLRAVPIKFPRFLTHLAAPRSVSLMRMSSLVDQKRSSLSNVNIFRGVNGAKHLWQHRNQDSPCLLRKTRHYSCTSIRVRSELIARTINSTENNRATTFFSTKTQKSTRTTCWIKGPSLLMRFRLTPDPFASFVVGSVTCQNETLWNAFLSCLFEWDIPSCILLSKSTKLAIESKQNLRLSWNNIEFSIKLR